MAEPPSTDPTLWQKLLHFTLYSLGIKLVLAILIFFHIIPAAVENFLLILIGVSTFILVNLIPIVFLYWLASFVINKYRLVHDLYVGIMVGFQKSLEGWE
jgi:hypothetical protein